MDPHTFANAYYPQAVEVSNGTGIDPFALLSQWAVETNWATEIYNENNLGNIRCVQGIPCVGGFSQFPSLEDFVQCAIATWHNGNYADVLASAGKPLNDQLIAIGKSPWDAGHYTGKAPFNYAGGSLIAAMEEFMSVGTLPEAWLTQTKGLLDSYFGTGGAAQTAPYTAASLMAAIKAIQSPPPAIVDLSPVTSAIAALKADVDAQLAAIKSEVDAIKAKTDKDLA